MWRRFPLTVADFRQRSIISLTRHFFRSYAVVASHPIVEQQNQQLDRKKLLTVSILGPPNAGKSTLFNRLLDKEINKAYRLGADQKRNSKTRFSGRISSSRKMAAGGGIAIVSHVPGTTRDRRECIGRIGGTHFRLIDTAGVDGERLDHLFRQKPNVDSTLLHDMMKQTAQAAFQSDLVLLMFDARVGVTSDLMETARWLRKYRLLNREEAHKKPVLMLANKVEGDAWNYEGSPVLESIVEAERIGFGTVVPISAYHGEGMADIAVAIEQAHARMQEQIIQASKKEPGQAIAKGKAEKPLQLAILGRQNVGKSTLVNALLKEDRVLVGARPGLTRDAIAVEWTWKGRPVQLVDTAGIRKRSRRDHSSTIEDMAVQDALRAMKVADVCVLVIDGGARMLQRQELTIIEAILKEGRSLVVAANKMDLVVEAGTDEDDGYSREDFTKAVREQLEARFPAIRKTPIVAMSSLTGEAVEELMPVVFTARDRWSRTISTGQLNRWLREVLHTHPAPFVGNVRVRIKYIIQTKGRPPTFLLFSNTDTIPESYLRYLTRNFQDTFEMFGMDVRLVTKKASLNPYEPTKKRGGMGLGGREARKKRVISNLKTLGVPKVERHRKRRSTRRSYIMR